CGFIESVETARKIGSANGAHDSSRLKAGLVKSALGDEPDAAEKLGRADECRESFRAGAVDCFPHCQRRAQKRTARMNDAFVVRIIEDKRMREHAVRHGGPRG